MFEEALSPRGENFESWNITRDGIRFDFDSCRVFGCAGGKQVVEIPFTALAIQDASNRLNPRM
jgi:hypothetical protein